MPKREAHLLPPPERVTDRDDADPFDHGGGSALLDALIDRLPEFVPVYLALAEAGDDDPGEPAVFVELADFVADRLNLIEGGRPVLARALELIEAQLDGADEADVIGPAFFDSFSAEDRRRLVPWLGPRSLAALESLDAPYDE